MPTVAATTPARRLVHGGECKRNYAESRSGRSAQPPRNDGSECLQVGEPVSLSKWRRARGPSSRPDVAAEGDQRDSNCASGICRKPPWSVAGNDTTRLVLLCFVASLVLSGRFIVPSGLLGQHWDWSMPASAAGLREMFRQVWTLWDPIGLGSYVPFRYGSALPLAILGAFGYVGLSGALVAKALIVASQVVGGVGMARLVSTVIRARRGFGGGRAITFAAGLLYISAPYLSNQVVAGDILSLFAYALIPWACYLCLRSTTDTKSRAKAIRVSAISGVIFGIAFASSAQPALWGGLLTIFLCLYCGASWKRLLASVTVIAAVSVLTNSFWLLPAVLSRNLIASVVQVTPVASLTSTTAITSHYDTVMGAIEGWTYYVPFFTLGLSRTVRIAWETCAGSLVALSTVGCLLKSRGRGYSGRAWLVLAFLVSVVIAAPGTWIGRPGLLLYQMQVWALLFRTPQHLVFPVAFLTPILFAVGTHGWLDTVAQRASSPSITRAFVGLAVLVASGFAVTTSVEAYLGPHRVPRSERLVSSYLTAHGSDQGRLLSFPGGPSKYFSRGAPSPLALDGSDDGNVIWNRHPAIAEEAKWTPVMSDRLAERLAVDELLSYPQAARGMLAQLAVQFVEVTPYLSPATGPYYMDWSEPFALTQLRRASYLHLVFHSGGYYLFQNTAFSGQVSVSGVKPATQKGLLAFATNGEHMSAIVVPPGQIPSKGTSTPLLPVPGGTSPRLGGTSPAYTLPVAKGCPLATGAATLSLTIYSSQAVLATMLLPAASNGLAVFEHPLNLSKGTNKYEVPLSGFVPQGGVLWTDRLDLGLAAPRVTAAIIAAQLVDPTGQCPEVNMKNWFMSATQASTIGNYGDSVTLPSYALGSNGTNKLVVGGVLATAGSYGVTALMELPGGGWHMTVAFGHQTLSVSGEARGSARMVAVPVGRVSLESGSFNVVLSVRCAANCGAELYGLALTSGGPGSGHMALCSGQQSISEVSPALFLGAVRCRAGGVLTLADGLNRGWDAAVTDQDGRTLYLQPSVSSLYDSWSLPPGVWSVRIWFAPQGGYVAGWFVTGATLALALMMGLLWDLVQALWRRV